MPIQIDFTGASSRPTYTPLPEGTYDAKILEVKQAMSKANKPKLTFTFGQVPGYEKRLFWRDWSLQPQALWNLKQFLTRLGIEVSDGEFEIEPDELVGLPCQLVLSVKDNWKGETDDSGKVIQENEVEDVLAPSDGQSMGW